MAVKTKIKELEEQLKLYKSIEKSNAQFAKMSRTRKRITIAEDVLASLKINKYSASPGTYLTVEDDAARYSDERPEDPQELLLDKDISCNVCAIGALFTSKVRTGNKCKLDLMESHSDDVLVNHLKGIFTHKELRIIEAAFEGDAQSRIVGTETEEKARRWYEKNHPADADKRLAAIMKNIIKNNGNFVL